MLGSIDDLSSIRLARRLAQPAEAFKAILDVNRALGGADLNEMFGRVLDGLMAVFPRAERGFILTVEPDGTLPLRAVRRRGGPDETPSLSRTIARQVLEEAKAVLISDATLDSDYKSQQSVASSLRTALVVPLPGSDGKPVGMVQLDSRARHGAIHGRGARPAGGAGRADGDCRREPHAAQEASVVGGGRSDPASLCCRENGPNSGLRVLGVLPAGGGGRRRSLRLHPRRFVRAREDARRAAGRSCSATSPARECRPL